MNRNVHIISHTHWDREWYINSKFVNEWLPIFFEELFATLEKDPDYRFVLDGQTLMVEDCCNELQRTGKNVEEFREKISSFAKKGQLILGPYYLQPDWQLASGEALIRNMYYGQKISHELGGGTLTGWLPDNFGQISQTPQIHKLFDMKGIVVWHGIEINPYNLNTEFQWVSPDGTTMVCNYLLGGYCNAIGLARFPDIVYERIRNEVEKIQSYSATGNVLLMDGYDQQIKPDDILEFVRDKRADFDDYSVKLSTPDELIDSILESDAPLQKLYGAQYNGSNVSVYPGILSSRMYLKLENDKLQRMLENYAEPLAAMFSIIGGDYPAEKLDYAWKMLLKNLPHDSICGVSVDDVHREMEERTFKAMRAVREILVDVSSKFSYAADTSSFEDSEQTYTVINPLPYARKTIVYMPCKKPNDILVVDENGDECVCQPNKFGVMVEVELQSFELKSFGLYRGKVRQNIVDDNDFTAENEFLKVICNQDGSLTVYDKINGRTYEDVGVFEDSADNGDEYNYSFAKHDIPYTTKGEKAEITVIQSGEIRKVFRIERVMKLPKSLSEDRNLRSLELIEVPIVTNVTLTRGDPVLAFHTVIKNTCRDHRLRVLFPTGIKTGVSHASAQFDVTSHFINPLNNSKELDDELKRVFNAAHETTKITQFPQKDFCALTDGEVTAAVINKGLPEYEIIPENNTVALTLFRAVGWLARTDLNTRTGDAGPMILTPEAQCLREMDFHYGFCSVNHSPHSIELDRIVSSFTTYAPCLKNDLHFGITIKPFGGIESGDVHLSTLKCAQDSKDIILRFYNVKNEKTTAKINVPYGKKAFISSPYEDKKAEIPIKHGIIELDFVAKEIITIRIEPIETHNSFDGKPIDTTTICRSELEYNFSKYEIPICVTNEEISSEEKRAGDLEKEYLSKDVIATDLEEKLTKLESHTLNEKTHAATKRMEAYSLKRAYLEAKISAIFAKETNLRLTFGNHSKEYAEYQEEIANQLRELSYALNLARIDKRVSEYIVDYYTHQNTLAEENCSPYGFVWRDELCYTKKNECSKER